MYVATIRNKVEQVLEIKGRSLSWLANQLELKSKQSLFNWLDETHEPRDPRAWDRIANILNVSKEKLLDPTVDVIGLEDEPQPTRGVNLAELLLDVLSNPDASESDKKVARYTILQMIRER